MKKPKTVFVFTVFAVLLFAGSAFILFPKGENTVMHKKITAEEAKNIMESGKKFVILDVRTENEFKKNRINGAILIPHDKINEQAGKKLPGKDEIILIYCRSGRRSAVAAAELANMGYKNVYDFGAISDWTGEIVSD